MRNEFEYPKKKIVIVECYSTAVNYIRDIRLRGYEPVLLERRVPPWRQEEERKINDRAYAFSKEPLPVILKEQNDYGATLTMIRELSPVLIIPGSDPGLYLAMRLSSDLGLKGNSYANFRALRDKFDMQKKLQEAGLRSIRSSIVHSAEEAVDFFARGSENRVVLKPTRGASSANVWACETDEEVKKAYQMIVKRLNERMNPQEEVMIQEYVEGEEYSLDTVSCEGKHAAIYGMHYLKRSWSGCGRVYDTDLYFSTDEKPVRKIVDYCFQVLDCLGIEYGPVHSEFIVDEKGPVLVEVNCRPAGSFQTTSFQDKVLLNHETAIALDSWFMDAKTFFSHYPERMHLKQPAAVKEIRIPRPIYVSSVTISERLSSLESFSYAIDNGEHCVYSATTDLSSSGGIIYLTSPEWETIYHDLAVIHELEKNGLHELFKYKEIGE